MKNIAAVVLACLTALTIALTVSYAYLNRNRTSDVITVTGLAQQDFAADLIVWSGTFAAKDLVLKDAFQRLKDDRQRVKAFLTGQGLAESEFVFSAIDIDKEFDTSYDKIRGQTSTFTGYRLGQAVSIESNDVERIEKIARDITELINAGVEMYSAAPSYYYTKLGKLKHARLGVFQIVAQNSSESYTWSGAYNTSSKNKTGAVTVKLDYALE